MSDHVRVIYKYEVPLKYEFTLSLPAGSFIRLLGVQGTERTICVWVEQDVPISSTEMVTRKFNFYGTGDLLNMEPHTHVGSIIEGVNGDRVWHLYEDHS